MIKIVNIKKEGKVGVYIGRGSIYGNKFEVEKYGRAECIEMYRVWARSEWLKNGEYKKAVIKLAEIARKGDLVMCCYCAPLACHGDILKEAVIKINGGE